MKLFKCLLLAMGMLLSPLAVAQSDEACARYAAYREASGEPVEGIKAVLQVIANRSRIDRMSACKVVARFGQFSWYVSTIDWKVPKYFLTKYRQAANLEPQVPESTYYFNNTPFRKIGVFYSKIGNHWFYLHESLASENRVHKGDV